jgi:hypothetical protein
MGDPLPEFVCFLHKAEFSLGEGDLPMEEGNNRYTISVTKNYQITFKTCYFQTSKHTE